MGQKVCVVVMQGWGRWGNRDGKTDKGDGREEEKGEHRKERGRGKWL